MQQKTPTTGEIKALYRDVVHAQGGRVVDCLDNGRDLYLRSILQLDDEVKPRDRMYGGVALRVVASEIAVAPYLLRQVCTNGLVASHSVAAWRVRFTDYPSEGVVIEEIRQRILEASRPSIFAAEIERIQAATDARSELRGALLEHQRAFVEEMVGRGAGPRFVKLFSQTEVQPASLRGEVEGPPPDPEPAFATIPRLKRGEIARRFAGSSDRSRFSLMNAVTSVARDTRAPELKWDLEVVGGAVGAGLADARSLGLRGPSVDRRAEWRRNLAFEESLESTSPKESSERQGRALRATR